MNFLFNIPIKPVSIVLSRDVKEKIKFVDTFIFKDIDKDKYPEKLKTELEKDKLKGIIIDGKLKYYASSNGRLFSLNGNILINRKRQHIGEKDVFVKEIIARCFIPNPNGYKKVGYKKEYDVVDNSVNNLYWIPEHKEHEEHKEIINEETTNENKNEEIVDEQLLLFIDGDITLFPENIKTDIIFDNLKFKIIRSIKRENENLYAIFTNGRIFSFNRKKYIETEPNIHGYVMSAIFVEKNKLKMYQIHRIVAMAFLENPDKLKYVDHIDQNRKNNNVENLKWIDIDGNNKNRQMYKNNKSGISGIRQLENGSFQAEIRIHNGKGGHITQCFDTEQEAIECRKKMEIEKEEYKIKNKKNKKDNTMIKLKFENFKDYNINNLRDDIKTIIDNEKVKFKILESNESVAYVVLDNGNIWSCLSKRYVATESENENDYIRATLCINGKKRWEQVNVLIATAFIPNPDNLPQVDHINNNKQDNRVCNLKWVSCSDNNHNKGMNPKNKSGTKGVCKKDNKWKAYITVKNISYEKIFDTKEEAIKCRKEYEEKYLSHLK